jgi:hypothetical protein
MFTEASRQKCAVAQQVHAAQQQQHRHEVPDNMGGSLGIVDTDVKYSYALAARIKWMG